jgi:hypothetical protein
MILNTLVCPETKILNKPKRIEKSLSLYSILFIRARVDIQHNFLKARERKMNSHTITVV